MGALMIGSLSPDFAYFAPVRIGSDWIGIAFCVRFNTGR
jgi:hypothetical protein